MSSGPSRLVFQAARQQPQWSRLGLAAPARRIFAGSSRAASSALAVAPATISPGQHQVQTPPPRLPRKRPSRQAPDRKAGKLTSSVDRKGKEAAVNLSLDLNASDVEGSWKSWLQVSESGQAGLISTEEIIKLVNCIEDAGGKVDDKLKTLFERLYQQRRWVALSKCMGAQLRSGTDDVLFDMAAQILSPWKDERDKATPREAVVDSVVFIAVACARRAEPNVLPLIRLVRPLAPNWILKAGAYDKTKEREVQSSGAGFNLQEVIGALQKCYSDPQHARKAFKYCRHAILAWGLDFVDAAQTGQHNRFKQRFFNLFEAVDYESVKRLLETAMEAREAEYNSWITMSADTDPNVDWDDTIWNKILTKSLQYEQTELAAQIWTAYSSVKGPDAVPSLKIWNALLTGYSLCNQWSSVRATWRQLLATGLKLDEYIYTTMITAMFRANYPGEALLIFEDFRQKVAKKELQWHPRNLGALLHGLLLADRTQEAETYLRDMIQGKDGLLKPDIDCINIFLNEYGRKGDFEKTVEMLKTMSDLGLEGDTVTYTTLMDSFTRAGIKDGVDQVFEVMQKSGLKISRIVMGVIVKNLVFVREDGSGGDFAAALDVLYKMETRGPTPDNVAYNTIIRALCDHDYEFEQSYKSGKIRRQYSSLLIEDPSEPKSAFPRNLRFAMALFDRMHGRGLRREPNDYHVLINGLLSTENIKDVQGNTARHLGYVRKAIELMEECSRDAVPKEKTWSIFLQRLLEQSTNEDQVVSQEAREYMGSLLAQIRGSKAGSIRYGPLLDVIKEVDSFLSGNRTSA